jgi:putative transposase
MACKLIDAAQTRWRAVNAPHLVALVRAGTLFHNGRLLERPIDIAPTEPSESTETEVALNAPSTGVEYCPSRIALCPV